MEAIAGLLGLVCERLVTLDQHGQVRQLGHVTPLKAWREASAFARTPGVSRRGWVHGWLPSRWRGTASRGLLEVGGTMALVAGWSTPAAHEGDARRALLSKRMGAALLAGLRRRGWTLVEGGSRAAGPRLHAAARSSPQT
ncbi:hypothetical protein PMIN01_07523 [Paraphaeosphaeria minitans]|uniref:Uncharacterized protein n=1 Tax=Paraphaeosphaeria minitans TaxID=565426 RepID=A0A9P6KQ13_9PLEO|nr:hypothetical protein PMIN01_07523 [Paraphaeosphaeria minitans]